MIWLYIFMPVIILSGIAIYYERKDGANSPDEGRTAEKLEEYPPEHGMNSFNPFWRNEPNAFSLDHGDWIPKDSKNKVTLKSGSSGD